MIIKLEVEEIKTALAKALEEKTGSMFGEIDKDDGVFEVFDEKGYEVLVSSLTFGVTV